LRFWRAALYFSLESEKKLRKLLEHEKGDHERLPCSLALMKEDITAFLTIFYYFFVTITGLWVLENGHLD